VARKADEQLLKRKFNMNYLSAAWNAAFGTPNVKLTTKSKTLALFCNTSSAPLFAKAKTVRSIAKFPISFGGLSVAPALAKGSNATRL
tara:strand:- start:199 stop:462 length:264 start_codon:yes stop_codon:yes gene_type:complete